ncbi:hypothetical protein COK55_13820 [Bacillus cereus]|nr:hypothetical protein COK55_13820 [Bacillus cereus]
MKNETNYDASNWDMIQGSDVREVLQAAKKRYGDENYIARNVQTYTDPHWVAERKITKGNAGISM